MEFWKITNSLRDSIPRFQETEWKTLEKKVVTPLETLVSNIAMEHARENKIVSIDYSITNDLSFSCQEREKKEEKKEDNEKQDNEKQEKRETCNKTTIQTMTILEDVPGCWEVFTQVDHSSLLYKDFEKETTLVFVPHVAGTHVIYDATHYHGSIGNKIPSLKLRTNITLDLDVENASSIPKSKKPFLEKRDIIEVAVSNKLIHFELFENLFYKEDTHLLSSLLEEGNGQEKRGIFRFVLDPSIERNHQLQERKNRFGILLEEVEDILQDRPSTVLYNRFDQIYCKQKELSPLVCQWILGEARTSINFNSNAEWKRNNYALLNQQFPCLSFLNFFYREKIVEMKSFYSLEVDIPLLVEEMSIVKYNKKNRDKIHSFLYDPKKGHSLLFHVFLNGQQIGFSERVKQICQCGDIVIHSRKREHFINEEKKETEMEDLYVLTAKLRIVLSNT
jgi:hypothetical protein